jgi:hypothetical protein
VEIRPAPGKLTLKDKFKRLERKQMPFAASKALNETAKDIVKAEQDALDKHIDRPTPFTKKAFVIKFASKRRLIAHVRVKRIQEEYLKWQVYGGTRPAKNTAIPVPVNIRLNKYGNISRGGISKALAKSKVFSGIPQGKTQKQAGIYQVMGGKRSRRLRLLAAYEKKAEYRKRFPFYDVAEDTTRRVFKRNLDKSVAYAKRKVR